MTQYETSVNIHQLLFLCHAKPTDPQSCPSNWTSACAQLTGHVSSQHRGEIQLQALEIEKDRDSDENNYPAGPNTCLDCAWRIFPQTVCPH